MHITNKIKATVVLLAAVLVAGVAIAQAAKTITTLWDEGKTFTEWDTIELTGNDVKQGDRLVITYTAAGSAAQDGARAEAPRRTVDGEGQIRLFVDNSNELLFDEEVTGEGTVDYTFTAAVAANRTLIVSARNLTITKVELETEASEPAEPLTMNNPSFEADGEKAASNGALELTGWTFSGVGSQFNNTELRGANSTSTTSQFGTAAPKDGDYFLFFRQGWNGSGNTVTLTSEALDVPAGIYMLSVAYKQHYSYDNQQTTNTFVGLSLVSGETTLAQGQSPAAAGVQGGTADATYFNDTEWSVLEVPVTVAEDVADAQVVIALNCGGQRRSDFCIDDVKLVPVSTLDLALSALREAIDAAKAQAATYAVGDGLFYYPESQIAPLTQAIADAEAAYAAAASEEAVKAATDALKSFLDTFAPVLNTPVEGTAYNVANATADGNLCIADGKVTVAHDATVFFTAVEGGYVLSNEGGDYIMKTAENNWTLTTTTSQAEAYVVNVLPVEGGYTISGAKGLFGLDNAEEGSAVYANKAQANHGLWTIAEAGGTEPVDPNDYTGSIVNADLKGTDGWNAEGTKGMDGSGIVKCGSGSTFDFCQTVSLPAGQYKLTAQAAYRFGSSEADEYAAIVAGTPTKLATLYATVGEKTVSQPVANRYDGASETNLAAEGAVSVNDLWVPNSSAAVKAWFAAGEYVNEVVFNLAEDGTVTIGIRKSESPEAGDYTVIGPWTLTRLGDAVEEPAEESQWIAFDADDVCAKGAAQPTYTSEDGTFVLTTTDTDGSKLEIDANNCYFGTAEQYVKFTHRLKTGGKSGSKNALALTIPAAGTLKVYVRTGSNSATDRTLVLTQGEEELYNKVVVESDAVEVDMGGENPTKVYPIVEVAVGEGTVNVGYPVNGLNFYAFEFTANGSPNAVSEVSAATSTVQGIYNLRGQRVLQPAKGLYIINGKKVVVR